jgi:hypothetical protein
MTNVFKRLSFTLAATVLTVTMIAAAVRVNAQDTAGSGGSGISLSPTRTELSLLPGSDDEVVITVRNVTSADIIARPVINDFVADNETGDPRLLLIGVEDSAASIRGFFGELEDIRLAPGESVDVTIPVTIPEDAFPGGYYGAIRYQAIPAGQGSQGDGQVSLTASVASLVLIEIPGDIQQSVTVDYVSVFLGDSKGSLFTKKPDVIGASITNDGGSFIKPFGKVSVSDSRGNEVFSYELNDLTPRGNVLPDSTRVFKDRLVNIEKKTVNGEVEQSENSPITWPGRYTISANISYGNGGEIFPVSSTFWYIPAWLIIALTAGIISLLAAGIYLYKKYSTKSTKRRK